MTYVFSGNASSAIMTGRTSDVRPITACRRLSANQRYSTPGRIDMEYSYAEYTLASILESVLTPESK